MKTHEQKNNECDKAKASTRNHASILNIMEVLMSNRGA